MALSRVVLLLAHLGVCVAFLPPQSILSRSGSVQTYRRSGQVDLEAPVSWSVRSTPSLGFLRPSLSQRLPVTSLQGFFNLGPQEIIAIAVVAAVVLGPSKLGGFAKDLGKVAAELKEVPKEFQAGVEEGKLLEEQRKAREQQKELMKMKQELELARQGQSLPQNTTAEAVPTPTPADSQQTA
uniref:Sec-independent protein translocase protein TatA n=1 Tax=Chromera velia CCMP2878 TaxID=1169474 RepID=A0A0G4I4S9_9ALVE|eukprot:Cvel_10999.t1-p1 / transcript=Cvel_10999.t1 / gene=Cvel_10999 / organism=Chromera_velia_CCMP2878 / gene_product=hypothetical protein / transcript_product=hypothetical protein / location=Cvel_scaffold677:57027-59708(-) / protein_length=181 / sequence_SO=supercontig / SO=protein_coding / is_pseudo=false